MAYEPETLPVMPTPHSEALPEAEATPRRAERRRWWKPRRRKGTRRKPRSASRPGTAFAQPPVPAWHDAASRRGRWAALKDSSGGLMADFAPRDLTLPAREDRPDFPPPHPSP
ncbi:hypothetical protein J1792_09425 [Streptomyces triculaminicus]|uniref:Uncharacterized protein n=1 Tax=Streptomyces triculaminicus TaxID=2816232 RepID=A0A939FND6_9ACTN|nr:hypothetical protein [Streptomyces triculaminicus]MBO0653005.1 hypothetical protein [Streptomyces triculaminicus]